MCGKIMYIAGEKGYHSKRFPQDHESDSEDEEDDSARQQQMHLGGKSWCKSEWKSIGLLLGGAQLGVEWAITLQWSYYIHINIYIYTHM